MAGALTHILIATVAALIVHYTHYRWEFAGAIFIGHLVPDGINFGFAALKQLTWKLFSVEQDAFFVDIVHVTNSYANWFTLGFFIFATTLFLWHFHYIKKKTMEEYDELYIFLLIGIILHLIVDVVIIETSPWI